MRVFILGATGSLGKQIIVQALERAHEVTVLVHSPKKITDLKIHFLTGPLFLESAKEKGLGADDPELRAHS